MVAVTVAVVEGEVLQVLQVFDRDLFADAYPSDQSRCRAPRSTSLAQFSVWAARGSRILEGCRVPERVLVQDELNRD